MTQTSEHKIEILLVEDVRMHRDFISEILEKLGCSVTVAFNGHDAISMVRQSRFDLILMDVEMPKMNGIEAARKLRDMRRHREIPDIPIVAITADHSDEMRAACHEAGMVDLIAKDIWKQKWAPKIREKLAIWLSSITLVDESA